jgi:hypothetical protein
MSALVYIRTPQGQTAAYDPNSSLPRKLRSLLKLVDGKTSADIFAENLKAFGDVHGHLLALREAGLVRWVSENPAVSSLNENEATLQAMLQTTIPANLSGFEPTLLVANSAAPSGDLPTAISAQNLGNVQARQAALISVLQQMSDFVMFHTPQHSSLVLKEIEEVQSFEDLAVLMGGYEFMAQDAGKAAAQHIADIQAQIKQWL